MTDESKQAETWALVEVMGHVRYAGRISESTQFGVPLLRVEVPEIPGQPAFEKHLGGAAIYSITPCTEAVARAAAEEFCARPITYLDLPTRPAVKTLAQPPDDFDPYEGYDGEDYFEDEDDGEREEE